MRCARPAEAEVVVYGVAGPERAFPVLFVPGPAVAVQSHDGVGGRVSGWLTVLHDPRRPKASKGTYRWHSGCSP